MAHRLPEKPRLTREVPRPGVNPVPTSPGNAGPIGRKLPLRKSTAPNWKPTVITYTREAGAGRCAKINGLTGRAVMKCPLMVQLRHGIGPGRRRLSSSLDDCTCSAVDWNRALWLCYCKRDEQAARHERSQNEFHRSSTSNRRRNRRDLLTRMVKKLMRPADGNT